MNTNAGHIVRMIGLVIEMLGVWAVYASAGAKDQARLPLPGGTAIPLTWLPVVFGFILWLTGTIMVYMARARRKTGPMDER